MATYLQIVNKVLRRMREPTVASVSENSYSLMVGEFVNDAKRAVESAWAWRALLDSVNITTVAGTSTYDLSSINTGLSGTPARENARVLIDPESSRPLIRVITDNEEMWVPIKNQSYKFVERYSAANDNIRGKMEYVFFETNPSAAAGITNLRAIFVPIPDKEYLVSIFIINPQNDLTTDSQVVLAPDFPITQIAYLYCLYERGEELGETLTLTSQKADQALADAISHDSSMTSDLIFRV